MIYNVEFYIVDHRFSGTQRSPKIEFEKNSIVFRPTRRCLLCVVMARRCLPRGYLPRVCLLKGCLPGGCLPKGCSPEDCPEIGYCKVDRSSGMHTAGSLPAIYRKFAQTLKSLPKSTESSLEVCWESALCKHCGAKYIRQKMQSMNDLQFRKISNVLQRSSYVFQCSSFNVPPSACSSFKRSPIEECGGAHPPQSPEFIRTIIWRAM